MLEDASGVLRTFAERFLAAEVGRLLTFGALAEIELRTQFLRQPHDGGEGTLGPRKRPLQLWPLERIRAECEAQEVTRAVPGLVLFGSTPSTEEMHTR